MENILEIADIKLKIGGFSIDIPRFGVKTGETMAIIGPNGAGKTTLMHTLALLKKPDSGTIFYKGTAVGGNLVEARRRIAFVSSEPCLLNMSVYNNVAAGLKIRNLPSNEIDSRVNRWMRHFGIDGLSGKPAGQLSAGEAHKTALARALALQPEVLFMDEPFSSLDPSAKENITANLQNVLSVTGKRTIIITTHNLNEVVMLADRITFMDKGRIIQTGTVEEVFGSPANETVARFTGMETLLHGTVRKSEDGTAAIEVLGRVISASTDAKAGENVLVAIRPENVFLTDEEEGVRTSVLNHYSCVIRDIVQLGNFYKLSLDCGFPLSCFITKQSIDSLGIQKGKSMYASFKATSVKVIKRPG